MEKIKKLIIIVTIISIIIMFFVIILCLLLQQEKKQELEEEDYSDETLVSSFLKPEVVEDRTYYNVVNACINQYYNVINTNSSVYFGENDDGEYVKVVTDAQINTNIYQLLSSEYIERNNITIENVRQYVENIQNNILFIPLEMRVFSLENVEKYIVHGLIENMSDSSLLKEIYIYVLLDNKNKTFAIEPVLQRIESIENIEMNNSGETIIKNEYNQFEFGTVNNETIANEYLVNLKRMILGKPSLAYQYLDETYKSKKFGTEEQFFKYIEKNKQRIKGASLKQYNIINNAEGRQIICIDNYENYYIFNEKGLLEYTVMLDQYTVDIPQFVSKYNSSNAQNKVALNIEKVRQALNDGDYKYVYQKLADSFKQNYFPTQAQFESYVKANFFEKNAIQYDEFSIEGNTYIFKITILDEQNKKTEAKEKTILMQLNSGTDFVMSFNYE